MACDQDLLWCKAVFINAGCVLCMSSCSVRLGTVRYCKCQQTALARIFFSTVSRVTPYRHQSCKRQENMDEVLRYITSSVAQRAQKVLVCSLYSVVPLAEECGFVLSSVPYRSLRSAVLSYHQYRTAR